MSGNDKNFPDWLKEWAEIEAGDHDFPEIEPRDYTLSLLDEFDIEAQLISIRALLKRNRDDEARTRQDIQELDRYIRDSIYRDPEYQVHLENQWVDELHSSVFQDAAHSMAAVGMLTPFIESLFVAIFEAIRKVEEPADEADPRRNAFRDLYWNPQLVIKKGEFGNDLIRGIQELAKFSGLESFLPDGYEKTLTALFAYRNNMFHNGFEWPSDKVENFQNRIKNQHWPEAWFHHSSKNDVPWIYYMSEDFIQHCLKLIDEVLDGVGEYLEKREA